MVERGCSRKKLETIAQSLSRELKKSDHVYLEGPLGVGKTYFAKSLLDALGIQQPPEGSPTFAIAHEYRTAQYSVIHLDLYRIQNEIELEEAGISAYLWERKALVISEWLSLFPKLLNPIRQTHRVWKIDLKFNSRNQEKRDIEITVLEEERK